MKEKFKNLSAPVGIALSIVAVILFTGLLLGLGFVKKTTTCFRQSQNLSF